jgi:hypothetical protein
MSLISLWLLIPIISSILIKNRLLQFIASTIICVSCLWVYSIGNMEASAVPDFDIIFFIFVLVLTIATIVYCAVIAPIMNWIAKKYVRKQS